MTIIFVRVRKKRAVDTGLTYLVILLKQTQCFAILLTLWMSFASAWLLNRFLDSFSRGAEPGVCVVEMKSERQASCHINIFNILSCCLQRHFLNEVCYTKKF